MADATPPTMVKLDPPEKERRYVYADGSILSYLNVTAFCARPSGSHRLELADGRKVIVIPGWRAVELYVENWTA